MELNEFLKVTPESLAENQEKSLRAFVVSRLRQIADQVEKKLYTEVKDDLAFSPAGDCMGSDNMFIPFDVDSEGWDIGDCLDRLILLRDIAGRKNEK